MLNIRKIGGALYFYWLETVVRSWVRFRSCKEKSRKRISANRPYSLTITVSENDFLHFDSDFYIYNIYIFIYNIYCSKFWKVLAKVNIAVFWFRKTVIL